MPKPAESNAQDMSVVELEKGTNGHVVFCPLDQNERYVLLCALYHAHANKSTMSAVINESVSPIIRSLRKRGLKIKSRGGIYHIADSDRRAVIDGLCLSDV